MDRKQPWKTHRAGNCWNHLDGRRCGTGGGWWSSYSTAAGRRWQGRIRLRKNLKAWAVIGVGIEKVLKGGCCDSCAGAMNGWRRSVRACTAMGP